MGINNSGNVSFGYNFNYANFANVAINRVWQVGKNDYDVKQGIKEADWSREDKELIRKQKLGINIFSNVAQYFIINAVMLKMDKQVNRNTLIAVAIPFLINAFIAIFSRTQYYQKLKNQFFPDDPRLEQVLNNQKNPETNKQESEKPLLNKKKINPELEEFLRKHNIQTNVSFGVSYTTVHLLGKLVNKLLGSSVQTYDVYSACNQLNMPEDKVRESTALKFMREMSSQLLENVIYFTVLIKLKKRIDKSFKLAVFLPAALAIGLDILNRSKAFKFLNSWSEKLFATKTDIKPGIMLPKDNINNIISSSKAFNTFLEKRNNVINYSTN